MDELTSRELKIEFDGFRELVDQRFSASDAAVQAAQTATERAAAKTDDALREYKVGANEWRDTVKDIVAAIPRREEVNRIVEDLEKAFDARIGGMERGLGARIDALQKDEQLNTDARIVGAATLAERDKAHARLIWKVGIGITVLNFAIGMMLRLMQL
jgi:hypothetical protein